VTAASWRGETACGGAADGECGRQQRAESLHSYRPMSTRAAATSRAAWSRVVARTSRAERSAAQGSAERGATSLVGAQRWLTVRSLLGTSGSLCGQAVSMGNSQPSVGIKVTSYNIMT
jgi:hypothetical protein